MGWAVAATLTTGRATGRSHELNGNMNSERWQSGLEILSAYLLPIAVPAALRYALLFAVIAAILWLWQAAVRRVVQAPALAVSAATGTLTPAIAGEIGRAACGASGWQSVAISGGAVSLK